MNLIEAASWRVTCHGREVENIVALSPGLPRQTQVVKTRSKRVSSKKQLRNWQDKSSLAPSNGKNELKGPDFSQIADIAEDAPSSPSRKDMKSEAQEVSRVFATDVSSISKREVILKACITTCTAFFAVGVVIRQATHLAAESGWPVPDSTSLLDYNVESWHFEWILGLVMVVSISRQLLLTAWPEFLESNDIANKEVLGPLQMTDYVIVVALPAISEELLFRGALLPLCGLDWKGVTITGLLFGVLHLSGGRKTAFAVWASIVGILYGLGCVATHSVTVPMAAHSANNLIGALIWRWKQQESSAHGD